MDTITQYLEDCVEEEAEHLLHGELRTMERARRSRKLLEKCRVDAQEHYAEDVVTMLEAEGEMNHWTVISYRRKPRAWAIAGAIKEQIRREND
jgi:hypothetical protein